MSRFGFRPYMPPEMRVTVSKRHKHAALDEVRAFIRDHANVATLRSRKFAQGHADLIIIAQNLSLDKIEVATILVVFIQHLASDSEFSLMTLVAAVLDADLHIRKNIRPQVLIFKKSLNWSFRR